MKRLAGFATFAALVIAFAAPAQDQPAAHPYFPLKEGTEWTLALYGTPRQFAYSWPEAV